MESYFTRYCLEQCVVKGCNKQSAKDKKWDGITFHAFPDRDQKIKQKWIPAIRQSRQGPLWQPTYFSRVCSEHFKVTDSYYTKKGLRRVSKTGYPTILPKIVVEGLGEVDLRQPPNIERDCDK